VKGVSYVEASCVYPGNAIPAVDQLDLDIAPGEFMVLVGPSGSGKSTALRMLAGLEDVSSGEIRIGGVDVSRRAAKDRDIAMVFQNYALYPHMNVAENIGFALKLAGVRKPAREARVREVARLLDLEDYLERKPGALSGGQRQRVAMGRAIIREPSVFLMDEPLSNLDAKLRVEMRANIGALQSRLETTTVYVTHDQVEAMTMGHRVAVLRDGVLQQCGTPRQLYDRPANAFVAGFIGSPAMNVRDVPLSASCARLGNLDLELPASIAAAARSAGLDRISLGIRPESFAAGDKGLAVEVQLVEELGIDAYVYASIPGESTGDPYLVLRFDGRVPPRIGDTVRVTVLTDELHAFHPATGERLG
jgi:multiple sugar transport system ATP-binding protein